jgi:hypothetical protein
MRFVERMQSWGLANMNKCKRARTSLDSLLSSFAPAARNLLNNSWQSSLVSELKKMGFGVFTVMQNSNLNSFF